MIEYILGQDIFKDRIYSLIRYILKDRIYSRIGYILGNDIFKDTIFSRIGYIGDVTKVEERTALMSILSGKIFKD